MGKEAAGLIRGGAIGTVTAVPFSQFNTNASPADRRNSNLESRGTTGSLYLGYGGYEIVPEENTEKALPALTPPDRTLSRDYRSGRKASIQARKAEGEDGAALHARNFLDGVRSRNRCTCDIETGHRSATAALNANIAVQTRSYLERDGNAERFTNSADANRRLETRYRAPYELPSA